MNANQRYAKRHVREELQDLGINATVDIDNTQTTIQFGNKICEWPKRVVTIEFNNQEDMNYYKLVGQAKESINVRFTLNETTLR